MYFGENYHINILVFSHSRDKETAAPNFTLMQQLSGAHGTCAQVRDARKTGNCQLFATTGIKSSAQFIESFETVSFSVLETFDKCPIWSKIIQLASWATTDLWKWRREKVKTLANSTVTLIPKLLSFLASSTSKISPGLGGNAEQGLKLILLDVFMEEVGSLTRKHKIFLIRAKMNCKWKQIF